MPQFYYGSDALTISNAMALARGTMQGVLHADVRKRIAASQAHVQAIVQRGTTVYGINTGFGALADTIISSADTVLLQHKILQSHSVGVGDAVPKLIARLMLVTKLQALAQGYSGVQTATMERILWHLEQDIIPVVPERGVWVPAATWLLWPICFCR